jgi:murein DD-endopeptidase MepM/ murein hydrolase activator NlpD
MAISGLFACSLLGAGCMGFPGRPPEQPQEPSTPTATIATMSVDEEETAPSMVAFPVEEYATRITKKRFGQYVQDRFTGYHAGDDIEFADDASRAREIPVGAIADGEIVRVSRVSGYGGVIVTRHAINGRIITALYGHLDLSSVTLRPGDLVTRGQFLANLGEHESTETDGERKHLHFGLYEGSDGRVNGYEAAEAGLKKWLDPSVFFANGG